MTLGRRIYECRKKKGYTQSHLARALCVTPQAISKWENDLSLPDLYTVLALAKLLGISLEQLLEDCEPFCKKQSDPDCFD